VDLLLTFSGSHSLEPALSTMKPLCFKEFFVLVLTACAVPHVIAVTTMCMWSSGCGPGRPCAPGLYCDYRDAFWSQCKENEGLSQSGCYVTIDGEYEGNRWGCDKDDDCCNPDATCGSVERPVCQVPCGITVVPSDYCVNGVMDSSETNCCAASW
jgi:hypothetical protein